jgi:hypothetical protein
MSEDARGIKVLVNTPDGEVWRYFPTGKYLMERGGYPFDGPEGVTVVINSGHCNLAMFAPGRWVEAGWMDSLDRALGGEGQ